jgi:hypothetical protein
LVEIRENEGLLRVIQDLIRLIPIHAMQARVEPSRFFLHSKVGDSRNRDESEGHPRKGTAKSK